MPLHVIVALVLPLLAALFTLWRLRNFRVLLLCLAVCLAMPPLWVGYDCFGARATSEPCVWGKALMPVFLGLALGLGAPLLYLSASALQWLRRKRRG